MAVVAGRGEGGGNVIRIVRCLKIRRVTGVTGSGHCLKLAIGSALVAGVAVDGCMRPSEREAVVVLLNLLDRNLPASNGVALFAVGSQLTPVNIGVAILTTLTDVGEYRLHVALRAGYRLMHAAKRISRLSMIELRNCANRPPRVRGMAVLAGSVQISMRTVGAFVHLRLRDPGNPEKRE